MIKDDNVVFLGLIPLRTSYIQIPEKIKGATLSAEQKENLTAGKKVTVEGMTSKEGNARCVFVPQKHLQNCPTEHSPHS